MGAVATLASAVGRVAWLAIFGTDLLSPVAACGAALVLVVAAVAGLFRGSLALLDSSLELIALLARIKLQTRAVCRRGSSKSRRSAARPTDLVGGGWGVADMLDAAVHKWPDRPFMVLAGSGEAVTFAELDARANRVARWLRDTLHVPQGATVALLVDGGPDYLALWLGAAKAGCTSALLNIHLRGVPLAHAVRTALLDSTNSSPPGPGSPRLLIASASLATAALRPDVLAALTSGTGKSSDEDDAARNVRIVLLADTEATAGYPATQEELWVERGSANSTASAGAVSAEDESKRLQCTSAAPVDRAWRRGVGWDASLFYIYTSGTTGLPKAATINHLRFWAAGCVLRTLGNLKSGDCVYCPLPLYHASGGMMGVSACLQVGCCLVHRAKFSASQFSADLLEHNCTAMQYIGELGRYLANAPPSPLDGKQRLRVALGNGLRPDVWPSFQKRYRIDKIVEFYAATEGNTNLFNNCASSSAMGAVGVVPWFAKALYPVRLAKVDPLTGALYRDPRTGRGAECQAGEVGQVLGLINASDPSRRFDGYTDRKATEAKVGRSVFKEGDAWFLSGDLMKQDAWGFFYWVDRAGDTFRWKGENVSTSEVEGVLARTFASQGLGGGASVVVADVAVYGVEVPHCEGRAGMAALALRRPMGDCGEGSVGMEGNGFSEAAAFDGTRLWAALQVELPSFAQPVFVRVVRGAGGLAVTATHKHQKEGLRKEGFDFFDPATAARGVGDVVFVRDPAAKAYVPLTADLAARISSGALRL
jgi:acyl-CoA synthetase (AMP-forming)/AMP-acid ligase II